MWFEAVEIRLDDFGTNSFFGLDTASFRLKHKKQSEFLCKEMLSLAALNRRSLLLLYVIQQVLQQ
jgi:hypothetical protein